MKRTQRQEIEELLDRQIGFLTRNWITTIAKQSRAEVVITEKAVCIQRLQDELGELHKRAEVLIVGGKENTTEQNATIRAMEETIEVLRKELVVAGKPLSEYKPRWRFPTREKTTFGIRLHENGSWGIWREGPFGGIWSVDLGTDYMYRTDAETALDNFLTNQPGWDRCDGPSESENTKDVAADTESIESKLRWVWKEEGTSYSVKQVGSVWQIWYKDPHNEGQSSNNLLNIDFPDEKSATIAMDECVAKYGGYKRYEEAEENSEAEESNIDDDPENPEIFKLIERLENLTNRNCYLAIVGEGRWRIISVDSRIDLFYRNNAKVYNRRYSVSEVLQNLKDEIKRLEAKEPNDG